MSNLVQELLAVSKIEISSFESIVAQELEAVLNLAQELLAVSKTEITSSFGPKSSFAKLLAISKTDITISFGPKSSFAS